MVFVAYCLYVLISADRMRSDFGFGDNDVNNIDKVIEALRELVCPHYVPSSPVCYGLS